MASGPNPLTVVLLAAGEGSRLRSDTPKPLHAVAGAPLLAHALRAALSLGPDRLTVVVGHGAEAVAACALALAPQARIVVQTERRGTGHAVGVALGAEPPRGGVVLVLYADTPFVPAERLAALRDACAGGAGCAVLGFEAADPGGYGRLILGPDGALARIVEAADATPAERAGRLCNAGVMAMDGAMAARWIAGLSPANARGELYLTDVVAAARAAGRTCAVVTAAEEETLGVNDRIDLAAAEAAFQRRARAAAMRAGVTLVAPETVFLAWDTVLGRDVLVEPFVVFGPGVRVEDGVTIGAFSRLEGCVARAGARIGPYARLRPGADVGAGAHVGNFVEIKNAALGAGAKVNHLSYLGDAAVGAGANIGAGCVTCNYDGVAKHRTEIGPGAFIGSNATLVAPLRLGAGVYVGAGSVATADAPDDALLIGRARQTVKPGFAARLRARLLGAAAVADRGEG